MDWPRARGILLAALAVVNLVLAYALWGPVGISPELSGLSQSQQLQQVRQVLAHRGIDLSTSIPVTPEPMPFLRVQHRPTVDLLDLGYEQSGRPALPGDSPIMGLGRSGFGGWPSIDPVTQVVTYRLNAVGRAERQFSLQTTQELQKEIREILRGEFLLPANMQYAGTYPKADTGLLVVEFVPVFQGHPVFSGFVRAEVSERGLEAVSYLWIQPLGYKDAPPKVVRPASEALLRLAGHLERDGKRQNVIEIRLGYYAGRLLTTPQSQTVSAWDTVPVWRIRLENGETYFINAFNGEIET